MAFAEIYDYYNTCRWRKKEGERERVRGMERESEGIRLRKNI